MLIIGIGLIVIMTLLVLLLFWCMRPQVVEKNYTNYTNIYAALDMFIDIEITRYKDIVVLRDKLVGDTALNPREYERLILETCKYVLLSIPVFVRNEALRFMNIEEIQDLVAKKANDAYKDEYLASEMETIEEFNTHKGEDR